MYEDSRYGLYEADFSEFGYREIKMASDLLNAYLKSDIEIEDGLKVAFNSNSANVFLTDNEYNVWMMNGDKLEQWFNCSECGFEGFKEDFKDQTDCKDCRYIYTGSYEESNNCCFDCGIDLDNESEQYCTDCYKANNEDSDKEELDINKEKIIHDQDI